MACSTYMNGLSPEARKRYEEKISLIGVDPYMLKPADFATSLEDLPNLSYATVLDYLVFRASPFTKNQMRAYKSLEAFVQFVCKWVQSIVAQQFGGNILIFGRVLHSQRVSEPPLKPWIILGASSGDILAAHCDCVAGLGEVCTHVAALLFAIQQATLASDAEVSVTDTLAYWIGPTKKGFFNQTISNTDFTTPECLRANVLKPKSTHSDVDTAMEIPPFTTQEVVDFLQEFKDAGNEASLFKIVRPFCTETDTSSSTPAPLTCLYDSKYKSMSLSTLRHISNDISISISTEQCDAVENLTRRQSKCEDWFLQRAGRITASKFKSVCRTSINKPSISLIRSVCYPHLHTKTFKQGLYGCLHEKDAVQCYIRHHPSQHNITVSDVGLIIHPDHPYFGASPDALITCDTCGEGCLEVKCPYCAKDSSIKEMSSYKKLCLLLKNDKLVLDRNHMYYYQVQMQLAISKRQFCDFVMWSPNDFFIERIYPDNEFWIRESKKALVFFTNIILPELLSKCFTESKLTTAEVCTGNVKEMPLSSAFVNLTSDVSTMRSTSLRTGTGMSDKIPKPLQSTSSLGVASTSTSGNLACVWCTCRKPDDGSKMVLCGNARCSTVWFHQKCIPLKILPNEKWLCDECKK